MSHLGDLAFGTAITLGATVLLWRMDEGPTAVIREAVLRPVISGIGVRLMRSFRRVWRGQRSAAVLRLMGPLDHGLDCLLCTGFWLGSIIGLSLWAAGMTGPGAVFAGIAMAGGSWAIWPSGPSGPRGPAVWRRRRRGGHGAGGGGTCGSCGGGQAAEAAGPAQSVQSEVAEDGRGLRVTATAPVLTGE